MNSEIKEYTNNHTDKLTSGFTHLQNLTALYIQLKLLKLENGMFALLTPLPCFPTKPNLVWEKQSYDKHLCKISSVLV